MDKYAARLEAKVQARNRVHQAVNEMRPKLLEAVRPFVGKKIRKVDGQLTKEFSTAIDPIIHQAKSVHVWHSHSEYSLSFGVRCQGDVADVWMYAEFSLYIGKLGENGRVLSGLYDGDSETETLRTDYTAEEVRRLREDWKAKQKAADDAHSKLYPFGEHDN